MGRHTYFGQLAAHDVMNGIDHANIDPELTVENWESKAIVRDGNYVWVRKGTYKDEQGKEITGYYVRVYASTPTLHLEKDFPEIETAMAYGNARAKSRVNHFRFYQTLPFQCPELPRYLQPMHPNRR